MKLVTMFAVLVLAGCGGADDAVCEEIFEACHELDDGSDAEITECHESSEGGDATWCDDNHDRCLSLCAADGGTGR